MLVSTVAFVTECTDDSRFRQLFRLSVFLADRSCVTGLGDVAQSRGSNIDDLGFTWTRYNFDVRSLGEPVLKSRSKPCSRADNFSSWLPIYSCCSLVTMALRFGHKSSGSSSFREVSTVLVSRFPEHPSRNTQRSAQASLVSRP